MQHLGASGCRILVMLIHALQQYQKKYGRAAICMAAVIVENLA